MSTNPKTKAYQGRVLRLAEALDALANSGRYGLRDAIVERIAKCDPGATSPMIREAMELAAENCLRRIAFKEKMIADERRLAAALNSFLQRPRPMLRAIEGGRGD